MDLFCGLANSAPLRSAVELPAKCICWSSEQHRNLFYLFCAASIFLGTGNRSVHSFLACGMDSKCSVCRDRAMADLENKLSKEKPVDYAELSRRYERLHFFIRSIV